MITLCTVLPIIGIASFPVSCILNEQKSHSLESELSIALKTNFCFERDMSSLRNKAFDSKSHLRFFISAILAS